MKYSCGIELTKFNLSYFIFTFASISAIQFFAFFFGVEDRLISLTGFYVDSDYVIYYHFFQILILISLGSFAFRYTRIFVDHSIFSGLLLIGCVAAITLLVLDRNPSVAISRNGWVSFVSVYTLLGISGVLTVVDWFGTAGKRRLVVLSIIFISIAVFIGRKGVVIFPVISFFIQTGFYLVRARTTLAVSIFFTVCLVLFGFWSNIEIVLHYFFSTKSSYDGFYFFLVFLQYGVDLVPSFIDEERGFGPGLDYGYYLLINMGLVGYFILLALHIMVFCIALRLRKPRSHGGLAVIWVTVAIAFVPLKAVNSIGPIVGPIFMVSLIAILLDMILKIKMELGCEKMLSGRTRLGCEK